LSQPGGASDNEKRKLPVNQLEQTIVNCAERELAVVQAYYARKASGATDDEAWLDYLAHFNGLNAYLVLAHQSEAGLSEECSRALLDIEARHAAAYRALGGEPAARPGRLRPTTIVDRNDIAERDVHVTILISGDNETTPEEAAHHAMHRLYERGEIAAWTVPALDD